MWKSHKAKCNPDYDALVKTAMTAHLGESVRELQRQQQQQQISAVVESGSEPAQTLCSVIEALFIHRLRDSFIDKVTNVLKGDVIRQPSPNFWPFLLGFSHRHTTEYLLNSCPWLRSDIGRCRGWIRLVLNDGMLTSYLELLTDEKRLLNDFYEKQAFLRDVENVDIALKLLRGIETLQFRLAVNSSILNTWSTTPLLLAGLWAPSTPVAHEAVVQGVDAALCFTDEDETLQQLPPTLRTTTCSESQNKVDADLAFRLIINSDNVIPSAMLPCYQSEAKALPCTPTPSLSSSFDNQISNVQHPPLQMNLQEPAIPFPGVETDSKIASSSSSKPSAEVFVNITGLDPLSSCSNELTQVLDESEKKSELYSRSGSQQSDELGSSCTFEDLLVDYSTLGFKDTRVKTPEVKSSVKCNQSVENSESVEPEFQAISDLKKPSPTLSSMLLTLNHERGLVEQNYRCFDCSRLIGLIYGPVRVCGYTGGYYCADCHCDDETFIPARIFLNGDWSKRKISKSARNFFQDIDRDPILDCIDFDPNIYQHQPQFAALLGVRTQLQHLSAFILTCRAGDVNDEFRKLFHDKDYLYEKLHLYSLADLSLIQSGQLNQQLSKIVTFGKQHVLTCKICILKGFLCELCGSNDVIFPFNLETTYRCAVCGALFHSVCMDQHKPCPRCVRWKTKISEK